MGEVSDEVYARLFKKKADEGYADKDWGEWFRGMSKGTDLDPTTGAKIRMGTKGMLPMWMNSFSQNLPLIRKGKTLRDIVAPDPPKRAVVIGRGPSVYKKKHLEMLAKYDYDGIIVACDGVYQDCLKEGIIPDYVVSIDGSPVVKKFFKGSLVKRYAPEIKLILCSQTDHGVAKLVKRHGFDVYWFQPSLDHLSPRTNPKASITDIMTLMTCSKEMPGGLTVMEAAGNVGSTSWIFSWNILKAKDVATIGFDFGYPLDMPLKETYYWDNTVKAIGPIFADTFYEEIYHPVFQTTSRIDPVFKTYRNSFLEMLIAKPPEVRSCNCTEGGTIFAPTLECMPFKQWLDEAKP